MIASSLSGAIQLPDGTWVRGRGLRSPAPADSPDFGLYLGGSKLRARFPSFDWAHEWIDWPDFWVPRDRHAAVRGIHALYDLAKSGKRVEVACGGGNGRTGTVLACLAILAGEQPANAVAWTRANYRKSAVETPWQRWWVLRFSAAG